MTDSRIEQRPSEQHDGFKTISATFAGYPVEIQRHEDWHTAVSWELPKEYNFEDFLIAVEAVFEEAEAHGYEIDGFPTMAVGSPKLDAIELVEYIRPLKVDDFEQLGISAEDISFLGLGEDLAHLTYNRPDRGISIGFLPRPHQIRSAFRFMAEMLPSSPAFTPHQIGEFVLGLPR